MAMNNMAEPIGVVSKTRVCIKNLPPRTTEQDLKEFLLKVQQIQLQITDCKILKNAQGKSRKVAFVGFRQPEQAVHVIEKFHRTYLNMSRITVEAATAKKDESNSNDDKSKTHNNNNNKDETTKNQQDDNHKNKNIDKEKKVTDSKVEEFLSLMGAGKSKSKFWSNDTAGEEEEAMVEDAVPKSNDTDNDSDSDSSSSSSSSSSDEEEEADNKVEQPKNDEKNPTKAALSDMDFLRSKTKKVEDLEEEVSENNEVKDDAGSDSDSDSSSSSSSSSSDSDSDSDDDGDIKMNHRDEDKDTTETNKKPASKYEGGDDDNNNSMIDNDDDDDDDAQQLAAATGASKTRLFVRNLAFETTEEELEEYFSPFGKLTECHIPVDDQKRNKGFSFITFESAVNAMEATNQLDKVDFQGRLLHILQARPPPQADTNSNGDRILTWKQKQELARKEKETKGAAATGEAAQGWSASFIRGDAVVDNLAERLGLRKGDILGVKDKLSSGDAAVRLALGETQIIEENREYFRQHGVDMDALVSANDGNGNQSGVSTKKKRSKTAILVKNLPFDTRIEELEKLFHVGQEPVNILLPPSRTIAMIEYGHSTDAKRAFRKLAYRRFKHVPIYLEWAPLQAKPDNNNKDSSSKNAVSSQTTTEADNNKGGSTVNNNDGTTSSSNKNSFNNADDDDDEGASDGISSTLYVKNLNFETTEETLQQIFEKQVGGSSKNNTILSVRIPRKVAPTKSGSATATAPDTNRSQSMGYGFVELASHELARKAMKMLQGYLIDGHSLQLAISSQSRSSTKANATTATGKKPPTKLMVRNVPFQATRTEILKLFGTFGQLKKVRLPKKFDGSHRGFAFVEYLTGKEALAAMNALSRTHLYGRHLVLEWASVEDDNESSGKNMDKLRDKAKRDAAGAAAASIDQQRKNKKIKFDEDY